MNKFHTCCFIGHRTIIETDELISQLYNIIETLIVEKRIDTFLFGSKSRFNSLCQETVTKLKKKYPHIKRIYVRAEYPYISDDYKKYLLENYEDTYYPERIKALSKGVYIERNYEMIDKSDLCIIYYDERLYPATRKSGTKIALNYAIKQGKHIIKLPKN
ncbi:MAG: DUF1273 domain-containing protein [Ruminococcaceae bacterium]|nr:DUF1273 domain-containing protein [Oscillospiraceae bacterium]MBE6806302.1 DUF1273 domain-containing protein [Oscillospiraceae bacterium]